jgi:hypothetical protein
MTNTVIGFVTGQFTIGITPAGQFTKRVSTKIAATDCLYSIKLASVFLILLTDITIWINKNRNG